MLSCFTLTLERPDVVLYRTANTTQRVTAASCAKPASTETQGEAARSTVNPAPVLWPHPETSEWHLSIVSPAAATACNPSDRNPLQLMRRAVSSNWARIDCQATVNVTRVKKHDR